MSFLPWTEFLLTDGSARKESLIMSPDVSFCPTNFSNLKILSGNSLHVFTGIRESGAQIMNQLPKWMLNATQSSNWGWVFFFCFFFNQSMIKITCKLLKLWIKQSSSRLCVASDWDLLACDLHDALSLLTVSQHIKFSVCVTSPPTTANAPVMLRFKQRWGEIDTDSMTETDGQMKRKQRLSHMRRQINSGLNWEVSNGGPSHFSKTMSSELDTVVLPSLLRGPVSVQSRCPPPPPLRPSPHYLLAPLKQTHTSTALAPTPHECSQSHYHNAMHQ